MVRRSDLDEPWPRQTVLERKSSVYPRLYIPAQGNYDRPTWYGESYKLKKKAKRKEPEKRSEGKKCEPGEA